MFRDRIVEVQFSFLRQQPITAAVIVLVFEAARKCVSACGGVVIRSSVEP
jgi:hypothetical protein